MKTACAIALLAAVALGLQGCDREASRTVVHAPASSGAGTGVARSPAPTAVPPQAAAPVPAPDAQALAMRDPGDTEGAQLLARRSLRLPVAGVPASALVDTYSAARAGHAHEAIDILAPRGSRVVAVDDGTVVKLFTSKPGGLTVYQFDPDRRLAYYYAHLDRYAEGLHEGMVVRRGDLIGYVGSTGNADAKAPHLHFAVFKLGPQRHWWEGQPVNPYAALRDAEPAPIVTASR